MAEEMTWQVKGRGARMTVSGFPEPQGLYDPQYEHDSCGVGFVVDIAGRKSHRIVSQALTLFTTPVVYLAFDRLAKRFGRPSAEASSSHANAPAD